MLAVVAALVGQVNPAAAVEAPPAAVSSPQPGSGDAGSPSAGPSASPSAAPAAGPTAAPTADPKAEHEAAVRELQQAGPTGPCPATLTPGTVTTCAIDPHKSAAFTITLTQPKDLVFVQAVAVNSSVYPQLTAPDGSAVTCEGYGPLRCATSQAGTYTLQVRNNDSWANGVSVSYLPLLTTPTCTTVTAADSSLGAPKTFHGSLSVGSAGDCYTLDLAAGDMLRGYSPGGTFQYVFDATGKELCYSDRSPGLELCRLTGTAPFRVTAQRSSGDALNYDLTLARLSAPEGCLTVEPQAFGYAPDLTATARCRILRATEAGPYAYGPATVDNTSVGGALFRADGSQVAGCGSLSPSCDLTPGDYTWVADSRTAAGVAFGMAFRSTKETRGCTATSDNGLVSGPAGGTFGAAGQAACRTLPTVTGNGVYLLNRPPAGGTSAAVTVYDAAGVKQCEDDGYPAMVCKLSGTAPFRAVLTGTPNQAYQLVIHRTGETAGCTAWPRTGLDGTWGAEVTLTADLKQACLALPADQHSTLEVADFTNTQNKLNASLQVVDARGDVACTTSPSSAFTCALQAGQPYTALLVNSYWGDSYKLARRDISSTANCLTPNSTSVGGPSLPMELTSTLDVRCVRISANATDKFWLSARMLGNAYGASGQSQIVDASGKRVCYQFGNYCQVTGSTSYTMVVLAAGYQDKNIRTFVDTWKVGTDNGWAPECAAHPLSVDGFALRTGVLTESATAYCGVIDMKPLQDFNVYGTSSATNTERPRINLFSPTKWDNYDYQYQCGSSYVEFSARCQATNNADAGKALLVISPAKAATPIEYSFQGVCDYSGCAGGWPRSTLGSISPATGAAGTLTQAVVRGSGLTLGTKLKLVRNGTYSSTQPLMKPVSVSANGTELHVLVDTNGLEPGSYDVQPDTGGTGSGLTKAYTVTAATTATKGRFVPVPPARILNTVWGVGAPAGRVGQGGVVTLQVAGAGGIPATGVTAVVMNVTAVNPTQRSAVSVYPSGQAVPDLPTVSFAAGQNVPNLVTVPLANGKVDLRNAWGEVDLGVDVAGYYTDSGAGSLLTPVNPARILNTVSGVGAPAGRLGWGGVVPLKVTGVAGVPATGVSAVVMSVTAVNPTRTGYVTAYPHGQAVPDASNVNFAAGQNASNLVTVPVGTDGKVDLYNAWGEVDLGVDVVGYYSASGATYTAAGLVRLMDTRTGEGARVGALGGAGDVVSLKVAGVEGVPATGVTSVLMNVTVVWPTNTSFLTVYPHGTDRPDASNINYRPGEVVSALVMVPVVDGRVSFANQWGSTDVVADLIGYFSA
ncbi:hypothetical protein ACFVHB_23430 [Kitasatospora sp. NPDC127111]|uniref:hypothetical protein n=1 Tax=Kitasatospora sp. NPDC127111 TaxID=3345363 RepID=UPI00363927B6